MLKRCLSIALVICMMLSLSSVLAFADYSYVDSFKENNMSAKRIVIVKGHAFVASGADDEATDVLNVYNLETRGLVATYSVPVYETGRDYFIENMYVVGDYMYISFNRNRGWGDPFVRKYSIDDMLGGTFKHLKTTGIRGDHVTAQYEDKIFYSEPGYRTLDIYSTGTDTSADVMSLSENDRNYLEKELKGILADGGYFYIYTEQNYRWDDDGIWAYSIPLYRFMSLYADGDGGSFTTKPLHFVSDDIFLNYDTSAYGYVKVTVLDEEGTELFRSEEIYGNEISHRLHAENLSGKTGTMRIELKEANLYALGSNMK